jgi:hypothetical protein
MVLKQTDLLPSFRAGLTTSPEALWIYYDQANCVDECQSGSNRGETCAGASPQVGRWLMERFRVRVRYEAKRGQVWELHVFPNMPNRLPREADSKLIGSSASPESEAVKELYGRALNARTTLP